jgi:heterodisulfide reductase subunit A-like polyferredoxin
VVDLADVGETVQHLPGVAWVQEIPFACHPEGASAMREAMAARGLGRAVVAACSCCGLDQICYSCSSQRLRCKGNLAEDAGFEFVNIREQCAFVHRDDPAAATAKAMDLVAAAVARARLAEPWRGKVIATGATALIVGHGPGAEASAEALTALGFNTARAETGAIERIRSEGGDFAVEASGGHLLRARVMILAAESEEERAGLVTAFGTESLFQGRDPLWAPVESRVPGIFLTSSTVAGWAAAARAVGLLRRGWVQIQPTVARVDVARCRGCGDCVAVCPVGALRLVGPDGFAVAQVSEALCQGCGACLAHCPTGAIAAGYSSDRQIEAMLEAMLA